MRIVRVTLMAYPTLASIPDSELTPGVNVATLAVEGSLLRVGLIAPLSDGTTQLTTPLERVREIRWAPDEVVPQPQAKFTGSLATKGNQGPRR